jgi:hypothetical protein
VTQDAQADFTMERRSRRQLPDVVPVGGAAQELPVDPARHILTVVQEIEAGTFGNQYRRSSLEVVVKSIAELRQIFKGADHAFLWKPKLRIPDIYETLDNQRAFGRFLDTSVCCQGEEGAEFVRSDLPALLRRCGIEAKIDRPAVGGIARVVVGSV